MPHYLRELNIILIMSYGNMHPQTESLLFSLPLELRYIIYKETFNETEVYIALDSIDYSGRRRRTIPSNVLLACKQASSEAIEVYYRGTNFEFPGFEQAVEWIGGDVLPKQIVTLIKHVTIWIDCVRVCKEVGCSANLEMAGKHYASELTKEVSEYGVVLKIVEVKLKMFFWGTYRGVPYGCACRQSMADA
jgi:hypothetical protein